MIQAAQTSINRHIDELKQQLNQLETNQLEYVIIAHSDHRLINSLKEAFVDNSIAIVSIPQNCWAMDDELVTELMDWVINELSVQGILLIGHSQGGVPKDNVQVCGTGQMGNRLLENKGQMESILDRVNHAQSCRQESEQHFVRELESLSQSPAFQANRLRNRDFVRGLFYRSESGVFCIYDVENRQFRALLSDGCIG